MDNTKVIILGASPNPARYSYVAASMLSAHNYHIVPIGLKKGEVAGTSIMDIRERPFIDQVDTITLYMNPENQKPFYEYILNLSPRRIIFNPGTENDELAELAARENIEVICDCTLVMLRSGYF
jgi:predicted CoA-binding protein